MGFYYFNREGDTSIPDATTKAEEFAQRFARIIEDFKKDPARQGVPLDVLDVENANAISLFENVVRLNDAIVDEGKRLENLVRGVFARTYLILVLHMLLHYMSISETMSLGIDWTSLPVHANIDFSCLMFLVTVSTLNCSTFPLSGLVKSLFTIGVHGVADDVENMMILCYSRLTFDSTWLIVIIFVDNSGADIILGIILPFARELLRRGSQVILAANYLPSLNDVTYAELIKIISKLKDEEGRLVGVGTSNLLIANSGNDLPVIDLTRVSQELGNLANDLDLVILEGMGRGIETNLYAQFKCDSLKIAMVEHPEVTEFLGSRFYDCVIKYDEV
ncbi:hypothetical protein JHK82_028488 [Glycine max]|nr:hypothetical protein JHK86_028612 [Glycine max]KAG5127653.1 hypothetical protein JHK82_028488 [Glycine max]KAG5152266.1 hypothetical protein JHK84_028738 [Glycine max]